MRKSKNIEYLLAKDNSYKITKEELRRLLERGVLGRVTGIIGPFVLRYWNGKLIISDRAVIYNASQSNESVQNRMNFAATVKFARYLNSIGLLNKIWKDSDVPGSSVHHKILKQNKVTGGHPGESNIIVPCKDYIHKEIPCSIKNDFSISTNGFLPENTDQTLLVIICSYDPLNSSDAPFELIHSCASAGKEIYLTEEQIQVCRRYGKYIIYSVLIKQSEGSLSWSDAAVYTGEMPAISELMESVVQVMLALYILHISVERHTRRLMFWDG